MGNRNKGQRETKKPKKDAKKQSLVNVLETPTEVVEIRKSPKRRDETEA